MERLRELREKRHITQVRLSVATEVSQETISAYESGKAMPSADTLVRLADFLNTSTDYLLNRINNDQPLKDIVNDITDKQLSELGPLHEAHNPLQYKNFLLSLSKYQFDSFCDSL